MTLKILNEEFTLISERNYLSNNKYKYDKISSDLKYLKIASYAATLNKNQNPILLQQIISIYLVHTINDYS